MRDQIVVETVCLWEWVSPHYAKGSLKAKTVSKLALIWSLAVWRVGKKERGEKKT